MTITGRNAFLQTGKALYLLLFAAFIVAAVKVYTRGAPIAPYAIVGGFMFFGLIAVFVFHRFFKRSTSPEMFFFMVFLLSISFEAFRGGISFLATSGVAPYFGELFTRAIIFGRFFGIAALFSAGLLSTGLSYSKHEVILGLGALASFALAAAILVDQSVLESTMLYRAGIRWELSSVAFALELFALINFILAAVLDQGAERIWIAVGIALVIISAELLHIIINPILGAATLVVFISGNVLFGVKTYSLHYWS